MPKVVYTPAKGLVQEAGSNVGGAMIGFVHDATSETINAAGAVSVSSHMTFLKPPVAGGFDVTLPNGNIVGQLKKIMLTAGLAPAAPGDVSDVTLTITSPISPVTKQIVFSVLGDTAELIWNGSAWRILATHNTVTGLDSTPVVRAVP